MPHMKKPLIEIKAVRDEYQGICAKLIKNKKQQ